RSTLTSIRFIDLYITNIEYSSETQGLPSSEIEIMLLIIGRRAGVFVRNTLRLSVLSLTECHSTRRRVHCTSKSSWTSSRRSQGLRTTFSCVFEGFSRELSSHYMINPNCNALYSPIHYRKVANM